MSADSRRVIGKVYWSLNISEFSISVSLLRQPSPPDSRLKLRLS